MYTKVAVFVCLGPSSPRKSQRFHFSSVILLGYPADKVTLISIEYMLHRFLFGVSHIDDIKSMCPSPLLLIPQIPIRI